MCHIELSYAFLGQRIRSGAPKKLNFGQKWPFLGYVRLVRFGRKLFWGAGDRAHRVCHIELSYAPLPQRIRSGSPKKLDFGPKWPF